MKNSISICEKSSTTKRASSRNLATFMLEMPLSLFISHLNSELIASFVCCAALELYIIYYLSKNVTYLDWIENIFADWTPAISYVSYLKRTSIAIYVLATLTLNWLIQKLKANQAFEVFWHLSLAVNHFMHKFVNNIIFLLPYWIKVSW